VRISKPLVYFRLILVFSVVLVMPVQSEEDHNQARQLKEMGKILPLQSILKTAQQSHPGRVLEVELENKNGRYVYEIELLNAQGEVWELYYDALTAELIKRKQEN
jgi:uncharacterized membrane protein YkoI